MSLFQSLKNKIQNAQQTVAHQANRQVNNYTVRQRKICLVVFALVSGIFCFLLIIGGIGNDGSGQTLEIDSVTVPQKINHLSMDSLGSLPSKVLDSLETIIKNYCTEQLR